MPEGPSIVIIKDAMQQFAGKEVIAVSGNSKIDQIRLLNQKVIAIKSWGKHFLICFEGFTLRIHFLMFGSYRINEIREERPIRLSLRFDNGELNLYSCSIKFLEGDVNSHYDWGADVMNDNWNPRKAKAKLKVAHDRQICDALLDQDIFAGVGNIIKNEVLYRVKVHPEAIVGKIPEAKVKRIIAEARIYSFEFLEWKKIYELKKHYLIYNKKICLRCNLPVIRKHTGLKNRRSFFCTNCQKLYAP